MPEPDKKPLTLFYCYAGKDKELCDELDYYLTGLKRTYVIKAKERRAGHDSKDDFDRDLNSANIVLLMISPHFIAMDEYEDIMEKVLQKQNEGSMYIACVRLRATFLGDGPVSTLRFLNEEPVKPSRDRDEICASIQKRLKVVCEELQTSQAISQEKWRQIDETSDLKEKLARSQLQSSVEFVNFNSSVLTPEKEKNERDLYYKGKSLGKGKSFGWGIIQAHGDVERDQQQKLVDAYKHPAQEMRMLCLHGETGAGKSTLAWRIAYEITQNQQRPYLFLQVSESAKSDLWENLSTILAAYTTPIVILVDDVFRRDITKDAYESRNPLSHLEDTLNVTIIATSRSNEIPADTKHLPFLKLEKIKGPSREEKERVMEKLNKKGTLNEAQDRRLSKANMWWVMMIELTEGTSLEFYVSDCLNRLRWQNDSIYKAYEYLCYAGVYQISIPISLLENMDERFYMLENDPSGEGLIVVNNNASCTSLHPVFARYALKEYTLSKGYARRAKGSIFADFMNAMRVDDGTHRNFLCSLFFYSVKIDLQEADPNVFLKRKGEVKDFLQQRANEIDDILEQHCMHHELWHYWRGLYNEVNDVEKLSLIEKLMAQKEPHMVLDWVAYLKFMQEKDTPEYDAIAVEPIRNHLKYLESDRDAYIDFLKLVGKWGREELWRVLIDETAQWLKSTRGNISVREFFMEFVEAYGTEGDLRETIGDTLDWLKENEEDGTIRTLYLKQVDEYGQKEDWQQAIKETARWLELHKEDGTIRKLYLKLVEKCNRKEDWQQVLEKNAGCLKIDEKDPLVRQAYWRLVNDGLGGNGCGELLIEEMASWFTLYEDDPELLATYLKLVIRWGTTRHRRDALDAILRIWTKGCSRYDDVLNALRVWLKGPSFNKDLLTTFFQLVAKKSRREDVYINLPCLILTHEKKLDSLAEFAIVNTRDLLKVHKNEPEMYIGYLKLVGTYGKKEDWSKALVQIRDWLAVYDEDTRLRIQYMKSVDSRGDEDDRKNVIDDLREWLRVHDNDKEIRPRYLKFVISRGSADDCKDVIKETKEWLKGHYDDTIVRQTYLTFVNNRGSADDRKQVIKETRNWLSLYEGDPRVDDKVIRPPYFKLVENRGNKDDWNHAIDETLAWLKEQKAEDDWGVYVPYLGLVARQGDKAQLTAAQDFMKDWLRDHPQEKGMDFILSGYASVLLKLEMYAQAEKMFLRTLGLKSTNVSARIGLAWAYYYQGKKKEALQELQRSKSMVDSGHDYSRERMLGHLKQYHDLESAQE